MPDKIRNRIERELKHCAGDLNKTYSLNKVSPLLLTRIKEFLLRKGKRIRPCLFVIGYLGFAKKTAGGLYRSALSLELLHDFFLVHDDIIDKSGTRRQKPSMHTILNKYLSGHKNIKFNGQDLAIVIGDAIYAMALDAFLSIEAAPRHKEAALKKFAKAGLYTAAGEFLELLSGIKKIGEISKQEIYKIYDLKTADYTFAFPLTIGATLAGAKKQDLDNLFKYGAYLGRAFQIKDDILGIFGEEKQTGKSGLSDLREAKKTILIWYAYNNTEKKNKSVIERILFKPASGRAELIRMRKIIAESGALDYARKEIRHLLDKARDLDKLFKMRQKYKNILNKYCLEILKVDEYEN